jgi:hypothetical protein
MMEGSMMDSDNKLDSLPLCGLCGERSGSWNHRLVQIADRQVLGRIPIRTTRRASFSNQKGSVLSFNKGPRIRDLGRSFRIASIALLCVLVCTGSYAGLDGRDWTWDQGSVELPKFETRLASSGVGYLEIGRFIDRLLHSRISTQELQTLEVRDDSVTREISTLMREFGAEEYSVPAEFVNEVERFIRQYQGRDRDLILRVLVSEHNKLDHVREILRRDQMPEDFAYMAVVESGFIQASASQEGAAGFWQFTEATAREYGMKVDQAVDERLDLTKSTQAASRYIRDLILDFGAGSSVMLAMAAYNSGREAVRRAVRNVKDPIKHRNFWYLYRTRALPAETRDYVPKVFAAIIVGRNPRQFGF